MVADEFVSQLFHFLWVGISIVPTIHDNVFGFNRSLSLGMRQGSPHHGLFPELLYVAYVVVCVFAKLFYHILLCIRVFVCTYVYILSSEYGILSFQIFFKQGIHEGVGFGFLFRACIG